MKAKKAERFLQQLEMQKTIIQNKKIELEQMREIAFGITAHSEGERVQSAGSKQKMADAVVRCVDMEEEINQLTNKLNDTMRDVAEVIEQLRVAEYDVLHKMYFQGMTKDEVAAEKGKSKSWVSSVRGNALIEVQKILNEREKENGRREN